jgi:hypothetical protein
MKKLILATLLAGVAATGAYAQGTIAVDNESSSSSSPSAATGGLFFIGNSLATAVPYTGGTLGTLNISVFGGATAGSLTPVVTLSGANAMVYIGIPGQFADPNGGSYNLPGVPAQGSGFEQVEVWTGSALTYAAALTTPGDAYATSPVFATTTGGPGIPPAVPEDLAGMPAVILATPEPSTIALGGLGAAALMMFRRRK